MRRQFDFEMCDSVQGFVLIYIHAVYSLLYHTVFTKIREVLRNFLHFQSE